MNNYLDWIPTMDEDTKPTERKIPLSKVQFQIACEALTEVCLTSCTVFSEMGEEAKPIDAQLTKHCEDARAACDRVVAYLIDRSI